MDDKKKFLKKNNSQQDTDRRFQKIERQLKSMDQELEQLASLKKEFTHEEIKPIDKIWNCEKCGARLGIYDLKTDELRVRYRDFFAWWKPGIDGYLKMVCRNCSHMNEIRYSKSS